MGHVIPRLAAGAAALLIAAGAQAGIIGLRPGGVGGLGPSAPHSLAPDRDRGRPERPRPPRPRPPRPHPGHPRPIPFVPFFFYGDDRRDPETIIVPVPLPGPAPEPEAAPPPPPDPQGPVRRLPARGREDAAATPAVGAAINPDVPLVILDWRTHALPEPPPGEVWVRLRREVLRIDATTRVVRAAGLPPSAPPEGEAPPR